MSELKIKERPILFNAEMVRGIMSMLRKMHARGDKISLSATGNHTVDVLIEPSSGKEVPDDWAKKNNFELAQSMRQIKKNGDVSSQEVADFFNGGGVLIQEQSVDEWLNDYSQAELN